MSHKKDHDDEHKKKNHHKHEHKESQNHEGNDIDQTNGNNINSNNILLYIIIVLLIIIAVGAFFLGKAMNTNTGSGSKTTSEVSSNNASGYQQMTIRVFDDVRCKNCMTHELVNKLKEVPSLKNANFEIQDFSDDEVQEYLSNNNISALPIFIFQSSFVDPGLDGYLRPIGNGDYYLEIDAQFDPFAKRSEKGNLLLGEEDLETLKEETKYYKGEGSSKYAWFEYTNFACPACIQFHKSGIHEQVLTQFQGVVKYATKHFHFFEDAYPAAEAIECIADELGEEGFYAIEEDIFVNGILDVNQLTEKAVALGAEKTNIETCLASDKHISTYESVKENGSRIFNVRATPTNILINLETGEYIKTSQNIFQEITDFVSQ